MTSVSNGSVSASSSLPGAGTSQLHWDVPRQRPRVRVKADLLPAIGVFSSVWLLGIALGVLWALLAPPQRVRVFPGGKLIPLQLESWHRFDDLVLFVLLGLGLGTVLGAGLWLFRAWRGPVVLTGAVLGSLGAGWLGIMIGNVVARMRYEVTATPVVGDVIEKMPQLDSVWVLLAPPFATALAYCLLAAWNGRDDLGRRLT